MGRIALALILVVGACSASAEDVPRHEPWQFGGEVPASLVDDLPDDGEVVVSLEDEFRTVVMVSFTGDRLAELVAYYDDRFQTEAPERSEYSVIAETEAVWTVQWILPGLEVRVLQCIDAFTRQFSRTCVAVDRH